MPELTDQVQAIAHYPDGSPVCGIGIWRPDGGRPPDSTEPLIHYGRDERRAGLTAKKVFQHPKAGRPGCRDMEGEALVGATIRIGGEIVERYVRHVVLDAAGKVADVTFGWADVREEELAKKKAAAVAAAQAELDAKPKRGKDS